MSDLHQPVLPGPGGSDYERYLRTDELLALQKTPDEAVHHDELLFQTVHQSSELWLKLAGVEVETATAHLRAGELAAALRLMRRATTCLELITTQIHMLEHMSPWEYQTVRKALGHGSGFDSPGFRRVHDVSPLLGEAFDKLLEDRGLTLVEMYRRGRELEELYQLAELLIEWDERIVLWRSHHLKVVERIIGGKVVGTQGTPVEVLGRRVDVRYYPHLWDVRNQLTAIASEDSADPPVSTGH
jgi:tryptophan 2,3-dioxygenase